VTLIHLCGGSYRRAGRLRSHELWALKVLQGSRQKSRLLPAATKLLSEKSAAGDFFPMN
jgi:hypothetical protein